jgi:putative DNA primase/helicase
MSFHDRTTNVAKGKWRGILMTLGLPEKCLKDRHGECPLCGGKDKFRWDNKMGTGSYICVCGAGDGMALAMAYTGRSFADVAKQIDGIIGNVKPDTAQPKQEMTDEKRREILRDTWKATQEVVPGDPVSIYLASRDLDELVHPSCLRYAPALRDGDGGVRPTMVAMVGLPGQAKFVSMHRTFLAPGGRGKAEMEYPKRLMPGVLPDGACIMLGEYVPGGPLGVAEGIETALAASIMFNMPVWSTISSAVLAKWWPPQGCDEVVVFGDNDPKFGGQAAAYHLAHRLAVKKINVTISLPPLVGEDWSDVHSRNEAQKRAKAGGH